jgi:hypothetical protein
MVMAGALLILAVVMLAACCRNTTQNKELELPEPEVACQTSSASWLGLVPGQSTKADVVDILGPPTQKVRTEGNTHIFVYPPVLNLVMFSYGNRIGFRKDGIVDWVDVWVLDSDGEFHTVAETAELYGTTLDRVYVNGVLDMFGPDQVYVWSECGVAVTAVSGVTVKRSEGETLPLAKPVRMDAFELSFRHPVHSQASVQPDPDVHQIVVRQFFFQPTSFDAFSTIYKDKIPYLDKQYFRMRIAE